MNMPVRIAQVMNRMDSGGIEAVVINYYKAIDKARFQFDFYVDERSAVPLRADLEALGARFFLMPSYSKPAEYQKALIKAFRENSYGIVHVHQSTMSLFALRAAKKAGVPVRICHNHTTASWAEGVRTLAKYILRPFNRLYATELFACSDYAARWMYGNRLVDESRVYIMPNAVEAGKFEFSEEHRVSVRKELGIADDTFVVGHTGRFAKQKNHAFLIDIFAELKKRRRDSMLLLVGEGRLMPQIRQKCRKLGLEDSVIFTGARTDVYRLYSAMDVFCLPSYYEGMPVVLIEARMNGLPVIASDRVKAEPGYKNISSLPLGKRKDWANVIETRSQRSAGKNVCAGSCGIDGHAASAGLSGQYDINFQADRLMRFLMSKI